VHAFKAARGLDAPALPIANQAQRRTRQIALPGPWSGWTCPSVFVDVGSAFARGAAANGEKIDLVGDDLAAIALGAVLVFPLGGMDAPLDRDQLALAAELGDVLAEAIEAGDTRRSLLLALFTNEFTNEPARKFLCLKRTIAFVS
jgi:hypothetical protein